MRGRKRIGKDALILITLLVVLGVITAQVARQGGTDVESRAHRSISNSNASGFRGWYLLLRQNGIQSEAVNRPPHEWPAPDMVPLIITSDEYASWNSGDYWDDKEAQDALNWVEKGGTLLVLASESNGLLEAAHLTLTGDSAASNPFAKPPVKSSGTEAQENTTLKPTQVAPFLSGVRNVLVPEKTRWQKLPVRAVPIIGSGETKTEKTGEDSSLLLVSLRGQGRIVALSSASIADNKHLDKEDNARLLMQIVLAYYGNKRVLFDEFHQGYAAQDSLWSVIGRSGQWAFWQLAFVSLLIAYTFARRFGLPRPDAQPPRVSSEYVASLADLYRRARARDAALEGVYRPFWRDLCRAAMAPADANVDEIARRAVLFVESGRRAELEQDIKAVVNECTQILNGDATQGVAVKAVKISEADLLRLARRMEEIRKELRLGREDT